MRRRDFIALGGAAAVVGPTVATAQQSQSPVVGFLRITSAADATNLVNAFRQGLADSGLVEGRNIVVEYRWADGHGDRLRRLAEELINRQVTVIVGHSTAVFAAKAATTTIPIVAVVGDDPVRTGMVANLHRPGGNVTGVSFGTIDVSGKRLGLLRELVPQSGVLAALLDTNLVEFDEELRALEAAAKAMDRRLLVVRVSTAQELDAAFVTIVQSGARALHMGSGPFFTSQRQRLVLLSTRHAIPTSYTDREFVAAGGLLSYGPSQLEAYRRAAGHVARIIRGEKAGELPFELPKKYELVVNLGTAKLLGLTVPSSMQLLADEVIE
jgi:putative tryptophan/tyrosine transport system substrate-binding protein